LSIKSIHEGDLRSDFFRMDSFCSCRNLARFRRFFYPIAFAMKTPLSLLLFAAITSVSAQDFLDPLVITASRSEQNRFLPYSVATISKDWMRDQARRTLPDALQYTPGVLVQKTTHGHGSPFIRGFTGKQNLLLVDGIRLNNSTWRSGPVQYWNTVDMHSIDHLELVKSQGSVLYGSDAIGGTLNAFTKSSNFMDQPEGVMFHHGASSYDFTSNGEGSHVGRIESSFGVGGKYGIHLGASEKDFGDIRDSALGTMHGTGYGEQAYDLRFDLEISPGTLLTFASQYVNQDDISRWHRTLQNPGWTHGDHFAAPGTWLANNYDQERSLTYLRIEQEAAENSSWLDRWTATISYQKSTDSEMQDRRGNSAVPFTATRYLQFQDTEVETFGLDLALESTLGSGQLVYGLDYYQDEVASDASRDSGAGLVSRPASRPVADEAHYDLLGLYGQYTWRPFSRWEISGGTRFTYAQAQWNAYRPSGATTDISGESSWTDLSSSLRASYEINDEWLAYASASQSFRSPNLADLTGNTASLSGLDGSGSPHVEPEKFLTLELGARGKPHADVQLQAAVFHTFSTDGAITSYTLGKDTFVVNGDDSSIYGIEAEAMWSIDECWTATAFAAWQEGKNEISQRTPTERWIPRMLPFTASTALRYTSADEKWWVEGRLSGAVTAGRIHPLDQAADNQRIPTNGTPGYLIASLGAGYEPIEHLQLTATLQNLLNDDYRIHGSGQNEPGFGAICGLKYLW
jgi:hemoglobin/transferrin/lactoferrin receptor protein